MIIAISACLPRSADLLPDLLAVVQDVAKFSQGLVVTGVGTAYKLGEIFHRDGGRLRGVRVVSFTVGHVYQDEGGGPACLRFNRAIPDAKRLVPIKSFFSDLDKWVRRRIRMCIWKQWKTGRTRAANLLKLGIAEHEAFTHGMSSKGPWVLSSSQAVHQALSTALLEERGLPSLLAIWAKLTAKSRIA